MDDLTLEKLLCCLIEKEKTKDRLSRCGNSVQLSADPIRDKNSAHQKQNGGFFLLRILFSVEAFPLMKKTRQVCLLSLLLSVLGFLANTSRQKRNNRYKIRKEKNKFLFVDYINVYIENLRNVQINY